MSKQANLSILVTLSLVSLAAVTWVAVSRVNFGFDLEWMEGGMLMHAVRLSEGKAIYGPPTAEFVPYFYTPGYPAIVALLGECFGISYALARGVSIGATLLIMYLIHRSIRNESSWPYGLLGIGVYAVLFRTNGAFYDLARPDSLFLALILLAMYLTRYGNGGRLAAGVGALCALSFLTKQTASVFFVAICIVHFTRSWRDGLICMLTGLGLTLLSCLLLNRWSDGWFWTYIFEGHQGHVFIWNNILLEYWRDLIFLAPMLLMIPFIQFWKKTPIKLLALVLVAHWSYAFWVRAVSLDYVPHMYYRELWYEEPRFAILILPGLMAALTALILWRLKGKSFESSWIWVWFFVAGCGVSGLNHSTQWAYANCFMPISVTAAILIALTAKDVFENTGPLGRSSFTLMLACQFIALYYPLNAQVPNQADKEALANLRGDLASRDGQIFMPANPFFAYRESGSFHTHRMGIQDVAFLGGVKDLASAIRTERFSTVVLSEGGHLPGLRRSYYEGPKIAFPTNDTMRMKTGYLTRLDSMWFARSDGERQVSAGVSGTFENSETPGWRFLGDAFNKDGGRTRFGGLGAQGFYVLKSAKRSTGRASAILGQTKILGINFLAGGFCLRCSVTLMDENGAIGVFRGPFRGLDLRRKHLRLKDGKAPVGKIRIVIADEDKAGSVVVDDIRLEVEKTD